MAKLTVKVEGPRASGKSRLVFLIQQALKSQGHHILAEETEKENNVESFVVETSFIPSVTEPAD